MRVRGDNAPGSFTTESLPKKPGYILVRFFENVETYEDTSGEQISGGYQYDEYHLELPDSITAAEIENSLSAYMSEAKAQEENTEDALRRRISALVAENSALLTQVSALDTQLTETQLALCDVYEALLS